MLPRIGDTICAVATPPGIGGVAMIRVSGPDAFGAVEGIFKKNGGRRTEDSSPNSGTSLKALPSHTVHYGTIGEGGAVLDDVLVTLFHGPRSYTGEDVVEISVHGSQFIQQQTLRMLMGRGVRPAQPGEFTLRAFMNGKFDLSQAEAVADLIAAGSAASHDLAISHLRGGFSDTIRKLRQKLLDFTALIELELDFSEEHDEFASRPDLAALLDEMDTELTKLIGSFSSGNAIKTGIPVAIIGKPNVGKSTLLNAILNEERAIVSEIPGTTRDAVEDTIVIGGYSFRFIDTAGLRETSDQIETMGIEKTNQRIREASIILYVFDASVDPWEEVAAATRDFTGPAAAPGRRLILVGNKTDMISELPHGFRESVEHETVFVSAKRKENIHLLAETLFRTVDAGNISDGALVSNTRHLEALQKAHSSVIAVKEGLSSALSPDLLTSDIRNALHYLGEITGEITTDEILGAIFSRFCIGK
jgi:tRNA modification GTPase